MSHVEPNHLTEADQRLLLCLAQGLPLVDRPYEAIALHCGMDEDAIVARIQALLAAGVVEVLAPTPGDASVAAPSGLAARLFGVMRSGVPMVKRPYEALGAMLGVPGTAVCEALRQMSTDRVIGPIAPTLRRPESKPG